MENYEKVMMERHNNMESRGRSLKIKQIKNSLYSGPAYIYENTLVYMKKLEKKNT